MAAWLVTTTKNAAINYMKKRARECRKADIELFSDLYSKEYAESAEGMYSTKFKRKVGYGWTILDALCKENENWCKVITMVYCLEKTKMWLNLWDQYPALFVGVLYRNRKMGKDTLQF